MSETAIDAQYTETTTGGHLVPVQAAVLPAVTPQEAKAAMKAYLELCESVLSKEDYQQFEERGEIKRFKKKSAVKKLQTFFNVTVRVREATRDDLGDGHFGFRVIATAQTPGGRIVEATGACSTQESRFELTPWKTESDAAFAVRQRKALARSYHDVLSTAETRATNRAVMNCIGVGGGEVTADEIQRPAAEPSKGSSASPVAVKATTVSPAPPQPASGAESNAAIKTEMLALAEELGWGKERRSAWLLTNAGNGDMKTITDSATLVRLRAKLKKIADAKKTHEAEPKPDYDELPL